MCFVFWPKRKRTLRFSGRPFSSIFGNASRGISSRLIVRGRAFTVHRIKIGENKMMMTSFTVEG